jgi:hypothetical protein
MDFQEKGKLLRDSKSSPCIINIDGRKCRAYATVEDTVTNFRFLDA